MNPTDGGRRAFRLPRRRLLQLAAATVGTGLVAAPGRAHAALAGVAAAPPQQAAIQNAYSFERATKSGFVPIASPLAYSEPVDIAAGWDGSLFVVDAAGAPHVYDSVQDRWAVYGAGIDAGCVFDGVPYLFRGPEVFVADDKHPAPLPIGALWPGLPDGFKLGVQGAAVAGGSLYLFRSGQYLKAPAPRSEGAGGPPGDVVLAALALAPPAQGATPVPLLPTASETATAAPARTPSPSPTPAPATTATPASSPGATPSPDPSATATTGGAGTPMPSHTAVPGALLSGAAPLTGLSGWPALPQWKDGVIDAVLSDGGASVTLFRGAEFVTVDLSQGRVLSAPKPTGQVPGWQGLLPPDWATSGFDAAYVRGRQFVIHKGPTVAAFAAPGALEVPVATTTATPEAIVSTVTATPAEQSDGLLYAALLPLQATAAVPTGPTGPILPTATSPAAPTPTPAAATPTPAAATPTAAATAPTSSVTPTPGASATPGRTATPSPTLPAAGSPAASPTAAPEAATGAVQQRYVAAALPGWPVTWNPVLQQAPRGRLGGLWAVAAGGAILHHDGTAWTQTSGAAVSVDAGADGSAYCIGVEVAQHNLYAWDGKEWQSLLANAVPLSQVAVGDAGRVWVRDAGDAVHRLANAALVPEPLVPDAAHITANADGTVWSCDGARSSVYRYISEAAAGPQGLPVQGAVLKVASTGFGAAHCLAHHDGGVQLYRYDSPYVFKTSQSYNVDTNSDGAPLELGLGNVYLIQQTGPRSAVYDQVVALDGHTGQEVSRSAPGHPGILTMPVFDALHDLVYVGIAPRDQTDGRSVGMVQALDARDLSTVRWSFATLAGVDAVPAVQGTRLCFGDRSGRVYMLDTAQAVSQGPQAALRWHWNMPEPFQVDQFRIAAVQAEGFVHAAVWSLGPGSPTLDLMSYVRVDAAAGTGAAVQILARLPVTANRGPRPSTPPAIGQAHLDGATRPAVWINAGNVVFAVSLDAAGAWHTGSYSLPDSASFVQSGVGVGAGGVWFGDNVGNLYGLDPQLHPLAHTPMNAGDPAVRPPVMTTPVVYTSRAGVSTVLFSVTAFVARSGGVAGSVMAFDPASGNVASVPTGATPISTLSATVINGVIYAAGLYSVSPGLPSQVFGIRVDDVVQGLRGIVVESQLMQDFDDPSQPTHNPNGVPRYQTQLTVVDDTKAPIPYLAVKLWADRPTTIRVAGRAYDVGPGDGQYAAAATGADGTLIVAGGDVRPGGGDPPDVSAPPLRVWASFMDPFERIVVFRDREFHNRLATAQAVADPRSPAYDDPNSVNLHAGRTYAGAALFTAAEQQQQQPQHIAGAIQTMTRAIGVGGPAGGGSKAAWVLQATPLAGGSRYLPYADLPGSSYSATNTPAGRPAVVLHPAGLSYASNDANSVVPTFAALTPAEAAAAIDALQGQAWVSSPHAPQALRDAAAAGEAHLGSWWSTFWDWLKRAVATVTHVIVSVAEDVYVGIRVIVDGVAHVFQQIVRVIEDVASAIASFFVKLAKKLVDVLEALSVVFHFGEVVKTQQFLLKELLDRINGVPGNPAYPGLAAAVKTTAIPKLDAFFARGERAINGLFDTLAGDVGGTPINQLKGSGQTVHTAFTLTPKGGGPARPHAPQCAWALQKLKTGAPGATGLGGPGQAAGALATGAGPLVTFIGGFAARLEHDANLSAQWEQVRQGFHTLGHASSAADFVTQGLAELLRVLALLLDGVLAVANAFLDGALGLIDSLLATLLDPKTGLLTRPIEVPVLTWLYQRFFGEPLTLLNLVTLVAAIPLTLVWRVVEGEWPAQSLGRVAAEAVGGVPPVFANLLTIAGGINSIAAGIVAAVADFQEEPPFILGVLATLCGLITSGVTIPLAAPNGAPPSPVDWAAWAAVLGSGMVTFIGALPGAEEGTPGAAFFASLISGLTAVMGATQLAAFVVDWTDQRRHDFGSDWDFGLNVASVLPLLLNPLKLLGEYGRLAVAITDGLVGVIVGLLLMAHALP